MRSFAFIIFTCLLLLACGERKTIIIDDVVQSKQQLEKLDTSEIFSYSKFPPGIAPPIYQKWNKDTVIVIKTRKTESKLQKERFVLLNRLLDSVDKGADILIVQDGMLVPSRLQNNLRQLSPDQLSGARIMEWETAKILYGSHAKPITLVINTYQPK